MKNSHQDNIMKLYKNSYIVESKIKELLGTNTPTTEEVLTILTNEKKAEMEKNGLVLFYGQFGWATGLKSGFGTASCLTIDCLKIPQENNQ